MRRICLVLGLIVALAAGGHAHEAVHAVSDKGIPVADAGKLEPHGCAGDAVLTDPVAPRPACARSGHLRMAGMPVPDGSRPAGLLEPPDPRA